MLNPKAEVARASQALAVNMAGARGIQVFNRTWKSKFYLRPRSDMDYGLTVAISGCTEDQPWSQGHNEDAGGGSRRHQDH